MHKKSVMINTKLLVCLFMVCEEWERERVRNFEKVHLVQVCSKFAFEEKLHFCNFFCLAHSYKYSWSIGHILEHEFFC